MSLSLLVALALAAAGCRAHWGRGGDRRAAGGSGDADEIGTDSAAGAEIDDLFSRFTDDPSPGCAVAVVWHGHVAFSRGYGLANLEHGVPITARTVFDIASTSKQFTAAAVLLLAQRGLVSLDDDVRRYIPELPRQAAPITLRQLIANTSGLPDYIELLGQSGKHLTDVTTDADALAVLVSHQDLLFPSGTVFKYSDSGYFLLSQVVQRATGKTLRAYAAQNLFTPLGMRDTQYLDDVSRVVPRRATPYAPATGGGFELARANWQQVGDGAVNTTVLDLAKWDDNFYTGAVGGSALNEALMRRGELRDGTRLSYAGGLVLDRYHGIDRVHHAGSWTGYTAEMMRFPTRHLTVITLCNLSTADAPGLCGRVADLYLDR